MSGILQGLLSNPYFSAGFGLFGVGAVGAVSRKALQFGLASARRKYVVSVELQSNDPAYIWFKKQWFLNWMSKAVSHTQHLSVATRYTRHENGHVETMFGFVPSVGDHFFNYKGTWIKAERLREKAISSEGKGSTRWEIVTLTLLGKNKQILFDLLTEAAELALKEEKGYTIIYTPHGHEWKIFGTPRLHRPFDSVILDDQLSDNIYEDVKNFLENPSWYVERGIPYRRGYLLHGPPGTGKSSFIQALAGRLQYSICILTLSDYRMSDDAIHTLLATAPNRSIILLEDVDAAFSEESKRKDEENKRNMNQYRNTVTFSGLLNALDGVGAVEGRILFMTTNHMERLDPALIRPGRVDLCEYIGHASRKMINTMFNRFYPEREIEFDDIITKSLNTDNQISMATVQGIFLRHKEKPVEALEFLKSNFENQHNPVNTNNIMKTISRERE